MSQRIDKTIIQCQHSTNADYCFIKKLKKCHYRCYCELKKQCKDYLPKEK